jgi:murein DD-endopeptidase MepM/ murein hydrolase activator NlpD
MNIKLLLTLWSFRRELKLVAFTMLGVLLLPVIAVILLTQTGINLISNTLVGQDPNTKTILLKHPTTGEVIKEISPTVIWPTAGVITLEFAKTSPYQLFHTGLDIAGALDTSIYPAIDGKVIYAGEIFWGYGKHVIIDHGDNITTIYGHMNKIHVYEGQQVFTTDSIGTQGRTGWATGVHLHFEIRIYNIPVNPRAFLDSQEEMITDSGE